MMIKLYECIIFNMNACNGYLLFIWIMKHSFVAKTFETVILFNLYNIKHIYQEKHETHKIFMLSTMYNLYITCPPVLAFVVVIDVRNVENLPGVSFVAIGSVSFALDYNMNSTHNIILSNPFLLVPNCARPQLLKYMLFNVYHMYYPNNPNKQQATIHML